MCSHRAFRHLAQRLANAGFAVLRFDYYGTGDSLGGPRESGLVKRWQDDIATAISEVRAHSGTAHVALLGLRIGATLATLAASQRDDLSALVLWSPCVTGRSYVREVTMLGKATPGAMQESASNDGSVESAGFLLSGPTCSDLTAIKLAQVTPSPERVLLLSRDDLPTDTNFADHLRKHNTDVTQQQFSGYDNFMVAPVKSTLPSGALDTIVTWLEAAYPATATPEAPSPGSMPTGRPTRIMTIGETHVREETTRFGPGLFGIITEPATRDPRTPGIVIMNTGGDHHVGPHRMYAPLVRTWATMGFTTLRFDISGLGESPARPGESEAVAYPQDALEDLRAAVAHLGATRGIDRFVIMGVCSGAYYSVHAAAAGIPMIGNIAVNPPLYWRPGHPLADDPYWTQHETKRVGRALLSPTKWVRLLSGKVDFRATLSVLADQVYRVGKRAASEIARTPRREEGNTGDNILMLFPNQVDTLLTFSGDDMGLQYLERQNDRELQKLLSRPNFELEIVAGADHTFMPVQWQDRLTELLTAHLVERYGPGK